MIVGQKKIAWFKFMVCGLALQACTKNTSMKPDYDTIDLTSGGYGSRTEKLDRITQPKRKLLIFDFWNDTPVEIEDFGKMVSSEMRAALASSPRLLMSGIPRTDVSTRDLVDKNRIKVAQLVREGRKLGVNLVLLGRISKIVFRQKGDEVGLMRQSRTLASVDLEVKLFELQGGKEILSVVRSGESHSQTMTAFDSAKLQSPEFRLEMLSTAVREAIAKVRGEILQSIDKTVWQGRIAQIDAAKIYLNAGRASGLVVGDIMRVLTDGEEIYDPVSGQWVGRSEGQHKGTVEVVELLGDDAARARIHSGAGFHEGDLVRLY